MEKNVLVADDDPHVTQALAMRLNRLGVSVIRSPDAMHALFGVERVRPDLVILDVNMPGGNGLAVAEMLAGHAELRRVPVIIHTGRDDQLTRIRCVDRRHHYVKKSPGAWEQIKQIVCQELNLPQDSPGSAGSEISRAEPAPAADEMPAASNTQSVAVAAKSAASIDVPSPARDEAPAGTGPQRTKVLCIDDDPDISDILRIRLRPYNVEVLRALNGMQGFWTALGERPDAIICDMCMAEGDGNYTVSRLKSHPLTENVPVIILTGQKNPIVRRTMLRQGVEAYLPKPLVFDELLRRLRALLKLPADADQRQRQRVSTP